MFWKTLELLARLIYAGRIRQADKIGAAAKLAGEGRPDEALDRLERLEPKLHRSLRSVHALTCGRVLGAMGRIEEAEAAVIRAAKLDPSNARAHLDLAVMSGKRFRFDDARARLERLSEGSDDDAVKEQALELLALIEQISSGEREDEFSRRALAMASKPIGPNGESTGLPADLALIDEWISRDLDAARESADEIALLLGQSAVHKGALWKINLSIEDSLVILPGGRELSPFDMVARRLTSRESRLDATDIKAVDICPNGQK